MVHSDNRPRLSDLAQEEILIRIRSGELPVGTRLPSEPELARQMGISRGILREALNALQTRGYISRTPRGGSHITRPEVSVMSEYFVQSLLRIPLHELINIREALESAAARLAIRHVTEEDIEHLRKLALYDAQHSVIGCRDFHYRLAELSGIHLLAQFIDFYFDRVQVLMPQELLNVKPKTLEQDHARILLALEKRTERSMDSAMRIHFRNIRKHYRIPEPAK